MLTRSQQARYRPLVERAWRHHCGQLGLDPGDKLARECWYREQVRCAIGVQSSRDADPVRDFDALISHFALAAGDAYEAGRMANADERRALWWLRQIRTRAALAGNPISDAYVAGIAAHMGYPNRRLDALPASALHGICIALERHLKRQTATSPRRHREHGEEARDAREEHAAEVVPF